MLDVDNRAVYLVVEPDPLLRADLTEALQDGDTQADVIAVSNVQDALERMTTVQVLCLALVAASPMGFATSALAKTIAEKGGQVVLMGGRAEALGEAAGYRVLQRPFSQIHITAMLV